MGCCESVRDNKTQKPYRAPGDSLSEPLLNQHTWFKDDGQTLVASDKFIHLIENEIPQKELLAKSTEEIVEDRPILHLCAEQGRTDLVKLLIHKGLNPRLANEGDERTPLMIALASPQSNKKTIEYLASQEQAFVPVDKKGNELKARGHYRFLLKRFERNVRGEAEATELATVLRDKGCPPDNQAEFDEILTDPSHPGVIAKAVLTVMNGGNKTEEGEVEGKTGEAD